MPLVKRIEESVAFGVEFRLREKAVLFDFRKVDIHMLPQEVVQRCGGTFVRADDSEIDRSLHVMLSRLGAW